VTRFRRQASLGSTLQREDLDWRVIGPWRRRTKEQLDPCWSDLIPSCLASLSITRSKLVLDRRHPTKLRKGNVHLEPCKIITSIGDMDEAYMDCHTMYASNRRFSSESRGDAKLTYYHLILRCDEATRSNLYARLSSIKHARRRGAPYVWDWVSSRIWLQLWADADSEFDSDIK